MKALKKTLSLVLAVCILASMACVAAVSASANAGDAIRRYNVKDIVNSDPAAQVETKTFMFYMPEVWRNTFNDTYDGNSLASCSAGIYWWEGSYNANDYQGEHTNAWPGFAVTETVPEDKNIFTAKVPADVTTIIWNNLVDGGPDSEKDQYPDRYVAAIQTSNILCEYYDANEDGYGFYPKGVENFDGMIYVCNPKATEVNEFSGKSTYKGIWMYYYGAGEYGIYPTRDEAVANNGVLKDGQFPDYGFKIDTESLSLKVGQEEVITPNDNTATAIIEDPTIASITRNESTGAVTVKGLKVGTTNVVFTLTKNGETETITCPVIVKKFINPTPTSPTAPTIIESTTPKPTQITQEGEKKTQKISAKSYTKTYGNKAFSLKAKTSGNGKLTYKTSNKKVVTVSTKGKVTIKGCGKATITIKAKATSKYKAASKKITITVKPAKIKLKTFKGNKRVLKIYYTKQNNADGYQCVYNRGLKKITTTSNKNYITLKNLKKGKCEAKIRAFKKISGIKVYGKYSKYQLTVG